MVKPQTTKSTTSGHYNNNDCHFRAPPQPRMPTLGTTTTTHATSRHHPQPLVLPPVTTTTIGITSGYPHNCRCHLRAQPPPLYMCHLGAPPLPPHCATFWHHESPPPLHHCVALWLPHPSPGGTQRATANAPPELLHGRNLSTTMTTMNVPLAALTVLCNTMAPTATVPPLRFHNISTQLHPDSNYFHTGFSSG